MITQRRKGGILYAAVKLLKVSALVLLSYLLQVSVMPHLKLFAIVPNLLMVCIAILTVSFGKKYAFAAGAVIGILLESTANNLSMVNLLLYPALGLLCAQIFADMSDIKRELLRIRIAQRQARKGTGGIVNPYQRKRFRLDLHRSTADDMNAHLRILLNALALTLMYEMVMLIYIAIALEGVVIGFHHFLRIFNTLLYTGLACVLMFPSRAFLGMYERRKRLDSGELSQERIDISDKDLRQVALVPDLPSLKEIAFEMQDAKMDESSPKDPVQADDEMPADLSPVPKEVTNED